MPSYKNASYPDKLTDRPLYLGREAKASDLKSPHNDVQYQLRSRDMYDSSLFAPSEFRAMYMRYTDPLSLNFKLLINVNTKTGFFGGAWLAVGKSALSDDEVRSIGSQAVKECPNSAIAYLFRIEGGKNGSTKLDRCRLWVELINDWVDLVRNWDFLQESVEGFDQIIQAQEHAAWVDAHFSITFRENVTSRVQRVIDKYRNIWWDSSRGVQVLPRNLQAMDLSILVYNSGYWGGKYDLPQGEYEKRYGNDGAWDMFPTLKKMQSLDVIHQKAKDDNYPFIYHLFHFPSAYYNYDSGADYFGEVSNLGGSEPLHTKMVFDFFSVEYSNSFKHGIDAFGPLTYAMCVAGAIQDSGRLSNAIKNINRSWLQNYADSWEDTIKGALNDIVKGPTKTVESLYSNIKGKVSSTLNAWANAPLSWVKYTARGWGSQISNWMTNVLTNNDLYRFLNANFGEQPAQQVTSAIQSGVRLGNLQNSQLPASGVNEGSSKLVSKTSTGGVRLFGNEEPLFPQSQIDTQAVDDGMSNEVTNQRNNRSQQSSITPPQDQLQGIKQDDIKFGQSQIDTLHQGTPDNPPQSQLSLNKQGSMYQGSIEQAGGSGSGDEKLNPNRQITTRKGF